MTKAEMHAYAANVRYENLFHAIIDRLPDDPPSYTPEQVQAMEHSGMAAKRKPFATLDGKTVFIGGYEMGAVDTVADAEYMRDRINAAINAERVAVLRELQQRGHPTKDMGLIEKMIRELEGGA